ncbi:hypothetical protein M8818_007147 [Zalaria obscura]|uniref:Uncharacterized protein n=1 Tax=Zalaria obscura TaxID=2024903 RepID=A0ACC3S4W7_9PEZI
MSIQRSSSGVRTLRAMFENNEETNSQNTRGTSPNGDLSPMPNGDRRTSRVRASFVSVDPSGGMEIDPEQTKHAHEQRTSTADLRRESMSLDVNDDNAALERIRSTIDDEREERRESRIISETIPEAAIEQTPAATPAVEAKDYLAAGNLAHGKEVESPFEDDKPETPIKKDKDEGVANVSSRLKEMTLPDEDMPASNPDKPVSAVEEEPGNMLPADPKEDTTLSSEDARPVNTESAPVTSSEPQAPAEEPAAAAPKTPSKVASPFKTPTTPASALKRSPSKTTRSAQKPANLGHTPRQAQMSVSSPAPKTPTSTRKPATGSMTSPKASPKASPKVQQGSSSPQDSMRRASRGSLTGSTASSQAKIRPQISTSVPAENKPSARRTSSVQTRPKSPTRPVKVPSHLMAPTASSAAKQEGHHPAKANGHVAKPQPRQSLSNGASTKPAPRQSLASSTTRRTEPRTSTSRAPDEGFLARMMRPTASSASKVHDKADAHAPPRRTTSVLKSKANGKPQPGRTTKPGSSGSSTAAPKPAAVDTPNRKDAADAVETSTPKNGEDTESAAVETPAFNEGTIR